MTLTFAARVRLTTKYDAVWRECAACGALAPLAPDQSHCSPCSTPAPKRRQAATTRATAERWYLEGDLGEAYHDCFTASYPFTWRRNEQRRIETEHDNRADLIHQGQRTVAWYRAVADVFRRRAAEIDDMVAALRPSDEVRIDDEIAGTVWTVAEIRNGNDGYVWLSLKRTCGDGSEVWTDCRARAVDLVMSHAGRKRESSCSFQRGCGGTSHLRRVPLRRNTPLRSRPVLLPLSVEACDDLPGPPAGSDDAQTVLAYTDRECDG